MSLRPDSSKPFSTAARVYPPVNFGANPISYQIPKVQQAARSLGGRRWVFPTLAVVALGAAVATDQFQQKHQHQMHDQVTTDDALKRRNQALMDAYGGKESLEDLENALKYYEVQ